MSSCAERITVPAPSTRPHDDPRHGCPSELGGGEGARKENGHDREDNGSSQHHQEDARPQPWELPIAYGGLRRDLRSNLVVRAPVALLLRSQRFLRRGTSCRLIPFRRTPVSVRRGVFPRLQVPVDKQHMNSSAHPATGIPGTLAFGVSPELDGATEAGAMAALASGEVAWVVISGKMAAGKDTVAPR